MSRTEHLFYLSSPHSGTTPRQDFKPRDTAFFHGEQPSSRQRHGPTLVSVGQAGPRGQPRCTTPTRALRRARARCRAGQTRGAEPRPYTPGWPGRGRGKARACPEEAKAAPPAIDGQRHRVACGPRGCVRREHLCFWARTRKRRALVLGSPPASWPGDGDPICSPAGEPVARLPAVAGRRWAAMTAPRAPRRAVVPGARSPTGAARRVLCSTTRSYPAAPAGTPATGPPPAGRVLPAVRIVPRTTSGGRWSDRHVEAPLRPAADCTSVHTQARPAGTLHLELGPSLRAAVTPRAVNPDAPGGHVATSSGGRPAAGEEPTPRAWWSCPAALSPMRSQTGVGDRTHVPRLLTSAIPSTPPTPARVGLRAADDDVAVIRCRRPRADSHWLSGP